YSVGEGSSNVVEVYVYSSRAQLLQFFAIVPDRLVIEGSIESQFVDQILNLCVGARASYGSAPFYLCDLADQRSHSAGGAGDEDGLASPGMANIQQPEVSRQAGHAEHSDSSRQRRQCGIQFP